MESYIKEFTTIVEKLKKQLKFKQNIKAQQIDEIQKSIIDAERVIKKINTEFTMISAYSRNEYKARIDVLKSNLQYLKNNAVALENQYNFENAINLDKNNSNKDPKKEPLIVDHILRYDKEGNRMNDQVKIMGDTNNNFNIGLNELKKQGDKMDNVLGITDKADQHLTLHQQVFGVMKNKALVSRLKLLFIVLFLFLADLIAVYIKLR